MTKMPKTLSMDRYTEEIIPKLNQTIYKMANYINSSIILTYNKNNIVFLFIWKIIEYNSILVLKKLDNT